MLRGKDIIQRQDAVTPLQKVYYSIQLMLIYGPEDDALRHVNRLGAVAVVSLTTDEERARLLTAMEKTHQGDYYKALAELRPILRAEKSPEKTGAYPVDFNEADRRFQNAAKMHSRRAEKEGVECS